MLESCAKLPSPKIIVACPASGCGAQNFSGFRFCQCCGRQRRVADPQDSSDLTDDKTIASRKADIFALIEGKAHERSKHKQMDMFAWFLSQRSSAEKRKTSVFEATPDDVVDFLICRCIVGSSRTVVHKGDCTMRSKHGECGCPKRMGHSALSTLASQLRTRFFALGCAGPWSGQHFCGNPADSALVRQYVTAVKEEQARAGCVSVSARQRAMLPDKLRLLIRRMRAQAYSMYHSNKPRFLQILQDIAWLAIQFRSLNRGAELGSLRTDEAVIGPNNSCIAFQISFSKTIRGGGITHEYGVEARPGDDACPVRAFRHYVTESIKLFSWDWSSGSFPVFPYIDTAGKRKSDFVTAGAMGQRFKTYLSKLFQNDQAAVDVLESLHGLRAGGALNMALEGAGLREIMAQGYWKSPETARHYIGLLVNIIGPEFEEAIANKDGVEAQGRKRKRAPAGCSIGSLLMD